MEEKQACISGKMSTLSVTPSTMTMIPFVGEEAIGKKIRIFDEGCVSVDKGVGLGGLVVWIYVFKHDDDYGNGKEEVLDLKDQMMELGIVEKEEDIDGKRIRVYDEGVVFIVREKLGIYYVKLDDGRLRAFQIEEEVKKNTLIEWETKEGHLTHHHQLGAAVKRIPLIDKDIRREWQRSLDNIKSSTNN